MNDPVRLLRRIAITVVGTILLTVGAVLLVTPGPGVVVIALALAVFAIEYEWARRRLNEARQLASSAAEKTATSQVAKACAVLFGTGGIGVGVVLIFTDILPFSGTGTGVCVALAGLITLATTAYSIRNFKRAQSGKPTLLRCSPSLAWRSPTCGGKAIPGYHRLHESFVARGLVAVLGRLLVCVRCGAVRLDGPF